MPKLPLDEERGRTKQKLLPNGAIKKRTSRWSNHASKTFVPGIPTFIPNSLSKQELDALLLRIRIEEIGYKIANSQFDVEYYKSRSPSPTPVYDQQGKRVNTKDQRAKQKLEQERAFLIEKVFKIYPSFKPPYDYRPEQAKKTMKIYIPVKKYPDYNFIGLIIGPRGMTQKQLEKESGARILIRGKGSVKEGRANNQENDDDLHVLITADTRKQLRRAAKMVKKILVPVEESKNKHKIEQLRELARINGTLRENNEWQPRTWKSADVYCKHCGELSHPTSDCPLKGKPVDKALIDQEYNNFMKEIGDTTELDAATSEVEASYQQFMAFLKVKPNSTNSNTSNSPTEGMPGIPPGTVGTIPPWQMPLYPQQPPVNQWPPAYNAAPPTYWAGPSGYGAPLPWR